MSQIKLLLVDDDRELCALLSSYLEFEGIEVATANDAQQALELLAQRRFDIAVFDIMMPGISGLELLQQLRPTSAMPIIMLTGKGGEIDRILGLEMGADDYLAKPCNPRELLARVRAVLRRTQANSAGESAGGNLSAMGIELNGATRDVSVQGQPMELTSAEFSVLQVLMSQPGSIVSKAELTEKVLHRQLTAYDRAIDVHLSRVRQKLALQLPGVELIKTVRGAGYLFVVTE
ncbi:MAG: response regulator transcription factor [Pseudomonadales bacterium]